VSTLKVTAEQLTIHPHPNADALELAQVGLYRAVVPLGVYHTGDYALYIPEQSVLPYELIAELGLTGRLGGKQHDRVTPVRLRGELSQGIVCRPAAIGDWFGPGGVYDGDTLEAHHRRGTDFAELLGITKWEPPIPATLAGQVEPAPDMLAWSEIENIARYPDLFTPGELVEVTEKIHGSACCFTYIAETGQLYVSSKGFAGKRMAIVETPANLYWRAIHHHNVAQTAAQIADWCNATRVGIFGEVYGPGVQDLHYGRMPGDPPGYAAFDIALDRPGFGITWHAPSGRNLTANLSVVPTLFRGPYNQTHMIALATGDTVLGGRAHLREGIVIRPQTERYSPIVGGRAIGKLVSPNYLTRKGGTEYE
jgi:RNA ligase (TIGR02306 family)